MDDRLPPRLQALICPIPWTGCWLFTGRWESRNGYGRLEYQGKPTVFHRVIYELLVGPIPDGLLLDHKCRVPACCNPDHLEPVTVKENTDRGLGVLYQFRPNGSGVMVPVQDRTLYPIDAFSLDSLVEEMS